MTKDIRYGPASRNLLDVYALIDDVTSTKPVLLFMHGGGFFSGDKRWSNKVGVAMDFPTSAMLTFLVLG